MSLAFTHLGTGSRGNATLVESGDAKILIDQGFSGKQLETRLARMEINPDEIDAIVLTHHHGDHGGGEREERSNFLRSSEDSRRGWHKGQTNHSEATGQALDSL